MSSSRVERRLAAIFAADMVGYSRLMEADEEDIIARQKTHLGELIKPKFSEYGGRIVKFMGDGMLVEFASVVDAVQCAVDIQQAMTAREAGMSDDRRICYRVGINLGDIIIDGDDILGDGVNIAARLEGLAPPGGICISGTVYQSMAGKADLAFKDMGEQQVKNIKRTIRAWQVLIGETAADSDGKTGQAGSSRPDKPSIAVLAFNNMSGDPEQEYFSDGISEDIITGLSFMNDLLVIARNSSFTYKGQQVDIKRVGEELGVRYVLEGSVRRGGNRVRVTGQLIDTQTGGHVWADRYDGSLDDIFALQDDITAKVLTALGAEITLAEVERARTRERSGKVDAWDLYLQALPFFHQVDKAGNNQAKSLLNEAIGIDPDFSSAYAQLAHCYMMAATHAWESSAREAFLKAEQLAVKSVALDDKNPLAHEALGTYYMYVTKPDMSVKELNRALELNPNLSVASGRLSNALAFLGRTDEALIAAGRANRGSPRDPDRYMWYTGIMNAQFAAGNYEECIEAGQQAILLRPGFYGAHTMVAAALPYLDRISEAEKTVEALLGVMPKMTVHSTARNPMFVREDDVARMLEGLRRAGLPE